MNARSTLACCAALFAFAPVVTTAAISAPSEVKVTPADGAVKIEWAPPKDAPAGTTYNVYWSTTPEPSTTTSDRKADAKSGDTIPGLTNGTRYYFAVSAVSGTESPPSSPAASGTPSAPLNGAALFEQCKHAALRDNGVTPYACVWMMGDGYAQVIKTGETSTSIGIGVQYIAFNRRPATNGSERRRMDDFEEGSIFFKKGALSTIDGSDQAPFASMVLDPQSASFSFDARFRYEARMSCTTNRWLFSWFCQHLRDSDLLGGVAMYGSAGSAKWAFTAPGGSAPPPATFNAFAYGIGPSVRILPDWMDRNWVTFTAAVYFTQRIVQGDPGMRHQVFGTSGGENDHTFTGVEPQLTLQINTVTVTASVPILSGSADHLSHGQFFMSVGLRTGALLN